MDTHTEKTLLYNGQIAEREFTDCSSYWRKLSTNAEIELEYFKISVSSHDIGEHTKEFSYKIDGDSI
ncbi:hypothetical protein PFISCL1PPCAC_26013, partial [Pristionchus fissidentatus]